MKNPKSLIIIGLIALAIGGILKLKSASTDKKNLEIAQHATSASEAAQAISRNNHADVLENSISMFCLGFGGVVLLGGIIKMVQARKET